MLDESWGDFGQQERLTVRLKELIRNYPRGVGIIKEFIQNADDAGAKSLAVLLDMRKHPARHIRDSRMATLLGPALLIANESVFSAKDFQSIQHIGESNKTESGPKTGRFGLGFNTCYNVTDYPSFVTGEYVVCFDPHQNAIAKPGGEAGVRGPLKAVWETSKDWLMTFTGAGLAEGGESHAGTIFRLPLRTPDQASRSEISKESFGKDAFDEIVRQLKIVGPEMLLFTKHLVSIEIAEISEGDDRLHHLLRIATSNPDIVSTARWQVHAEMDGDLPHLLPKWKAHPASLPCTTYTHEFSIHDEGQARPESWRVTHGLFCDPKKELLLAAEAMLGIGEKAMPWAGAAVKLSNNEGQVSVAPIEGRIYCGLPLTDETPLPLHINGYFDLDSSRRALSADRNIIGANRVRVDWNELLMQHGAAAAYARLLVDCVTTGQADVAAFYDVFPNLSLAKAQLLSTLGRSVYHHIHQQPVIRVATVAGASWLPVGDVWLSPEQLREPLVAEGKAVADPGLPKHIQSGFEANNVSINSITPKLIRDLLQTDHDIDSAFEAAPRPCLSRRDWVEELLQYCLREHGALKGLPLALLADGKLHTFGYSKAGVVFSASEKQRAVFRQEPHWFIDVEFEEKTGLQEQRESGFYRMTSGELVANLGAVLGKDTVSKTTPWQADGGEAPNSEWLLALFDYLAGVPRPEFQKLVMDLQRWPLIPDQHGSLHPLNSDAVPIFRPDEPIYKKLIAGLELLGVSFIDGTTTVVDSIRQFATAHPSPELAGLVGPRLVSLLSGNQRLSEYAISYDARVHDPILNFLSEERFVAAYTEAILKLLRAIPIFPTTTGGVVQATAPDLFVPTDYKPPSCSPSVLLLKTGPENRWRKLLHKLGVLRLHQHTLIEKVLVPKYGALSDLDQVDVLKWVRDHLTQEVNRLDKAENGSGQRLLRLVRAADLIKCTDGTLHAGEAIYDPREQLIREVLGNRAPIPDMRVYPTADPNWLTFFELLGMASSPRAQDLLNYIDSLILAAREGTARVSGQLIDVFEFMQANWSSLSSASVNDGNAPINFTVALKNRAWLPAQRNPKAIEEFPGFTFQQDRLYRPDEIYAVRLIHQIGSVLPILPTSREVEREVRLSLGMPSQAPIEAICRHFDHLIDLWNRAGHSGIQPERIGISFKEIYRAFGTIADEAAENPQRGDLAVTLQVLRTRYQGRGCIWDSKRERLWKPTDVFVEGVPFFEPRRARIVYSEDRVNAGLAAVGRRTSPSAEDYLTFLSDLQSESTANPLSEEEQTQVIYALRHIADAESDLNKDHTLPILARDGRLRSAQELLWEDTIRFRGKIDLSRVPIVHDQVPLTLVVSTGVQRMSEHLIETLLSEPDAATGHGLEKLCRQVSSTIRSVEFSIGLRRLLRHQTALDQMANPEVISRMRVISSLSIQTEITLHLFGNNVLLGTCNANSFFRASDSTLFVSASSERQVLIALAKAINVLLHPLSMSDLSALQEILKAEPANIDGILDDYEVPRIEASEQREIKYEESARYDNVETEEEAHDLGREEPPSEAPESTLEDSIESVQHKPVTIPSADEGVTDGQRTRAGQSRETTGAPPRIPYGSDDNPPIIPGTGKTHWEKDAGSVEEGGDTGPTIEPSEQRPHRTPGHRDRIVTYVEGSQPGESRAPDRKSEADAIGDAAVNFVLDFERRSGRSPKAMDHGHEGFDVLSEDISGEVRYIEVKGIDGAWDDLGVGISRPQFFYAQNQGDRFWLYVVENARSASPTPHCINDPVSLITQYRFDAGWKDLAKNSTAEPLSSGPTPTEGMRVSFIEPGGKPASGTIIKLERKGLLVRLHIRTDSGIEVKQFINASMKFSRPTEEGHNNAEDAPRVE